VLTRYDAFACASQGRAGSILAVIGDGVQHAPPSAGRRRFALKDFERMEMSGEYTIPAPQATVWAALNDPDTLRACIPGCQTLEKTSDTTMTATVVSKIGPVKATFTGAVTLSNIDAPNGYTISGEGKGGPAGFAKGGADVKLTPAEDGGTRMQYTAKAQIGGKLAQLGSRLIDSTAKKMADEFFGAFAARVGAGAAAAEPAAETADEETAPVEEYVNAPANVPVQHSGPGEPMIEDKAEEAAQFARDTEQKLEVAAGKGVLGGPVVWGLLALIVVVVLIKILY
jgi:carbon monoxide dehydrogenase subunit G